MTIQFDATWANAWRDTDASIYAATGNYDAAWVFMKYSIDSANTVWNHVTLKAMGGTPTSSGRGIINPAGFSQGTTTVAGSANTLDIIVPTEATSGKKGAFVQISSQGAGSASGTVRATGLQFLWDYGTDIGTAVSCDTTAAAAVVNVMGVEMVYIPQGQFYAGTPTANTAALTAPFYGGGTVLPFQISSEASILIANSAGNLWFTGASASTLSSDTGYAGYPKGYAPFYIMKYELNQGQYRDFLNTLTRTQQATRVPVNVAAGVTTVANYYVLNGTSGVNYINVIRLISPITTTGQITFGCDYNTNGVFNEAADGEWISCNFLGYQDIAAYGAWAALRPMTELEFEKAARGANAGAAGTVVDGEFPWGAAGAGNITAVTGASNVATSGQTPSNGGANCVYNNSYNVGPFRVGSTATGSTTKAQAGASYYGVLDLAGNTLEPVVTVANATGQGFIGSHGTGVLSANGNATNADWPGYSVGEVTAGTGSGVRGGSWGTAIKTVTVADRSTATTASTRTSDGGGRLVRTAP